MRSNENMPVLKYLFRYVLFIFATHSIKKTAVFIGTVYDIKEFLGSGGMAVVRKIIRKSDER